jgi:hypothetical protein
MSLRNLSWVVLAAFWFLGCARGAAAPSLSQQVDPQEANVGDEISLTFTIQNGSADSFDLPSVDGLQVTGSLASTNISLNNGAMSSALTQTYTLVADHPGDYTIPSFAIHTTSGDVLRTNPVKIHVVASGAPSPPPSANANRPFSLPNFGPVFQPPANQGPPPDATAPSTTVNAPIDSDGRPAKVFMVITPKTTDAYVGENVPLRIDFYIRLDAMAQQDSLPTIKGSDFLMNDLNVRGTEDIVSVENEPYRRQTWLTAIAAPKSGDFPLQMERDTYWVKSGRSIFTDPFGASNGALAHANIPSNKLIFHARTLPAEGRPADFTGAIGQFEVTGNAAPSSIDVGDPAYLNFSVTGEGNFDSVRSPFLAPDPAWKRYAASSEVHYEDEAHTRGVKNFRQAVIPLKNGTLPLPAATFSYFDPTAKKYVTLAIPLPDITVTGTPLAATSASASAGDNGNATPAANPVSGLAPNRLEFGRLYADLQPVYRQPWYWISQAVLLILVLILGPVLFFLARRQPDLARREQELRRRSLQQLEQDMTAAVARGDAVEFFLAARRAVQTRWGLAWGLRPETITLAEMEQRDPPLAEAASPLFQQADLVMYSGQNLGGLDLADWERHVREDLLQAQPA